MAQSLMRAVAWFIIINILMGFTTTMYDNPYSLVSSEKLKSEYRNTSNDLDSAKTAATTKQAPADVQYQQDPIDTGNLAFKSIEFLGKSWLNGVFLIGNILDTYETPLESYIGVIIGIFSLLVNFGMLLNIYILIRNPQPS